MGDILGLAGAEHLRDFLLSLEEGHAGDVRERDVPYHRRLIHGGVEARDEHEATIASLGDDAGKQRADLHDLSLDSLLQCQYFNRG